VEKKLKKGEELFLKCVVVELETVVNVKEVKDAREKKGERLD
jgi:hypothetical protein